MGVYFIYPQLLLLLVLVPVFILVYFSSFYYHDKKAINFPNFDAMKRVFGVEIFSRNFFSLYVSILILVSIILAVSGMVVTYPGQGSVVIAVDTSQSMLTTDVLPNRLEAAKASAQDFVSSLPSNTEISIVRFSGKSTVVHQPDTSKLEANLVLADLQYEDGAGTDFDELLYTANILTAGAKKKFLVMISDGQANSGEVNESIRYAKDAGLIVNTISVGTETGGISEGGTISRADEYSLQRIAFETGGQYSKAEDLASFERAFKELSVGAQEDVSFNLTTYLLLFSLMLIFVNWMLQNFRFRTIP